MNVCLVSDLHADRSDLDTTGWPKADVLLIAGDTANCPEVAAQVINDLSHQYPRTLVVDGNHEHYDNASRALSLRQTRDLLRNSLLPSVTLLSDHPTVKIGDHYFVGANGWYSADSNGEPSYNRARYFSDDIGLNDNRRIGFAQLGLDSPWGQAWDDAQHISTEMMRILFHDPVAKFVVLTHTAPHREMVSWEAANISSNPFFINGYMTPIMENFAEWITLWHHGHTHHRNLKRLAGTTVVANPRGRPPENPNWEPVVLDL